MEVLRYPSARDLGPPGGTNVAILACRGFASRAPVERQTWRIHVGAAGIRALCASPEARLGMERESFAGDSRIATMRWERGR
jgi:hypothetical protein